VILVGLTGGIGSGKSTVSALLRQHGALIVDADAIVRELQQPGSPVLDQIADRFGASIIAADGSLDRAALATIVFGDDQAIKDLNTIVHPAVGAEMNRRVAAAALTDQVVVMDIPLLAENPRKGLQAKIVVDVDPELAVHRLVSFRRMSEADARARIARQSPRADRLAIADRVIDNNGDLDELTAQVDELWAWLHALAQINVSPL
jgi:dephospho-CoA kinase